MEVVIIITIIIIIIITVFKNLKSNRDKEASQYTGN